MTAVTPPVGWEAVCKFYGYNLETFPPDDASPGLEPLGWKPFALVTVQTPAPLVLSWDARAVVSKVSVHRAIAGVTADTLREVYRAGLWHHLNPYGGGYAWRSIRGGHTLSFHALGAALDFDPLRNPLGGQGAMPVAVIDVFERFGWTWGGLWHRADPQHFQFGRV